MCNTVTLESRGGAKEEKRTAVSLSLSPACARITGTGNSPALSRGNATSPARSRCIAPRAAASDVGDSRAEERRSLHKTKGAQYTTYIPRASCAYVLYIFQALGATGNRIGIRRLTAVYAMRTMYVRTRDVRAHIHVRIHIFILLSCICVC